ncbi:hypothetical protein FIBSPDRAFT_490328 [Athelia psychrophila]|uniref:Uncharacterized protein n=1 Tax=Athelia psychrophila TaxID=1759441 RepID=A0A166KLN5_9AGAM|nr:hypothetical protein FIBSPDRAFT_490328 [Fibularhizoctonia sp. CBS 109695]
MSTVPTTTVFTTPNASGKARINNVNGVLNINPTYQVDLAGESKIYHWLGAPDSSGDYHAARENHHAQTGAWFIEGGPFVHWKETPDSALWIYGTRESPVRVCQFRCLSEFPIQRDVARR